MTPVISPWVFYAMSVVGGLEVITIAGLVVSGTLIVMITILWVMSLDGCFEAETVGSIKKFLKTAFIAMLISCLLTVFVPSEKTIGKMIVAQNVTYERMEVVANTVETVYNDIMGLFEDGAKNGGGNG